LIFDQDHQFKIIKPVGPKIVGEARFIGHALDMDAKMIRDEGADIAGGKDFSRGC
jgi:hypothetical protein